MTQEEKPANVNAIIGHPYTFGPAKDFESALTVSFIYSQNMVKDLSERHFSVYKLNGGETWIPVESWVDSHNKTVQAHLTSLGTFALGYDQANNSHMIPREFALEQNYPNPFNPQKIGRAHV